MVFCMFVFNVATFKARIQCSDMFPYTSSTQKGLLQSQAYKSASILL